MAARLGRSNQANGIRLLPQDGVNVYVGASPAMKRSKRSVDSQPAPAVKFPTIQKKFTALPGGNAALALSRPVRAPPSLFANSHGKRVADNFDGFVLVNTPNEISTFRVEYEIVAQIRNRPVQIFGTRRQRKWICFFLHSILRGFPRNFTGTSQIYWAAVRRRYRYPMVRPEKGMPHIARHFGNVLNSVVQWNRFRVPESRRNSPYPKSQSRLLNAPFYVWRGTDLVLSGLTLPSARAKCNPNDQSQG